MSLWDREEVRLRSIRQHEVRSALEDILAERTESGDPAFKLVKASDHRAALVVCALGCCVIGVDGTPRNASTHARQLRREARKCPRDPGDVRYRRRDRDE